MKTKKTDRRDDIELAWEAAEMEWAGLALVEHPDQEDEPEPAGE